MARSAAPWSLVGVSGLLLLIYLPMLYAVGFGAMGRGLLRGEVAVVFVEPVLSLAASILGLVIAKRRRLSGNALKTILWICIILGVLAVAYSCFIVSVKGIYGHRW